MNVSIVIPVYYNEETLGDLTKELMNVLNSNFDVKCYELIFVDDGSKDNSWKVLLELKKKFTNIIKLVRFSRNFGQVAAIYAGYKLAQYELIITISADLQDPPNLINSMIEEYKKGFNIVICHRKNREESLYRRVSSALFYWLMRKLSFSNMPEGGFDFLLISSTVKNILISNYDSNPFWQGQILWTGFDFKLIPYTRLKRLSGKSRWSFSKKIKYLFDGMMSYSYTPIRLMTLIGLLVAAFGFVYAIVIILLKIFGDVPFKGWAPIMILILILSGFQMLMLGIIGEYLWRALDQVRHRPLYIIEEIHR